MRILYLALALLLVACTERDNDGALELLYASPYGPSHPFSTADKRWIEFVEAESGGAISVRTNWAGGLLGSDHSMVELAHGVADIGLITPVYMRGGAHLIGVQTGFYTGVQSIEGQVDLYRCMESQSPALAAETQGLKVLAVQGGNLPGIMTTDKPVNSLDDLVGMRIRAPNELLDVMKALGADPVDLPMNEVYSSLAKGVIDGVVAPPDTFKAMHFAEVTGHFTQLYIPRGGYPARAMGWGVWETLSDSQQAILERSIPVWQQALAEEIEQANQVGFDAAESEGVKFHDVSAADQIRFDAVYDDVVTQETLLLSRYGIDGLKVKAIARASVNPDGSVTCRSDA